MGHLPKHDEITDLVWLNTSFLGDMILSTAAIELGRQQFPKAEHHLISTKLGCDALRCLGLDSYTEFDKRSGGFMNLMRTQERVIAALNSRTDAVLLAAHRSYRSGLLATVINLPTVAYQEADFAPRATLKIPRVAVMHEAVRVGLLLEPLGVPRAKIVGIKPKLPAAQGFAVKDRKGQMRLEDFTGTLIGIAPGSVWGTKRWVGYSELAKELHRRDDTGLVILGSPAELEECQGIANQLTGSNRVWELAGKTSLDDLRAIYPRLSLLVANDSSPIHYASSFKVPTIAIFGATIKEMGFGPLADRSIVIGEDLACRPCSDHGPKTCPLGHFNCMKQISPQRVLRAVEKVLEA